MSEDKKRALHTDLQFVPGKHDEIIRLVQGGKWTVSVDILCNLATRAIQQGGIYLHSLTDTREPTGEPVPLRLRIDRERYPLLYDTWNSWPKGARAFYFIEHVKASLAAVGDGRISVNPEAGEGNSEPSQVPGYELEEIELSAPAGEEVWQEPEPPEPEAHDEAAGEHFDEEGAEQMGALLSSLDGIVDDERA